MAAAQSTQNQEIVERFSAMRQQQQQLAQKVNELQMELSEHSYFAMFDPTDTQVG